MTWRDKLIKTAPWLFTLVLAIGLTRLFWATLWAGGGLVGGDIYSYFYPQKQFYGEALRAGEIPLWNNRTGHGYPTVGESQTGVFYPFHLLYAVLDLNTAYNSIQIGHYVLAFIWCWLLARRWGLATVPAWLAATVYTYGWLPPRMCVEWAALGAAWFPAALWCLETFLQTGRRRYLGCLSLVLAVQMLAGHFHLAFITQLTVAGYVVSRLWWWTADVQPAVLQQRSRVLLWCSGAVLCGFGLAALQLGPTWELKQLSQRAALGDEHDPGYGFIPWSYLGQLIAPWDYYAPGYHLAETSPGSSRTNTVEAHLYCGLLPLIIIGLGLLFRTSSADPRRGIWWLFAGCSLLYATGTLMPVARHLPGFGFFNGVGRYGIIFNLSIGLLSGEALQRLVHRGANTRKISIMLLILAATVGDTWWVSNLVQHSVVVAKPPLNALTSSPIRDELSRSPASVRLFCRGANLPNLLGVASTPVYLGIGPREYFDPQWALPQPLPYESNPTLQQVQWLQRAGVTHILSFTPLDLSAWPATLLVATPDPFLNRAWGRSPGDAFFLYELAGTRGRVAWETPSPSATATITDYRANSVTISTDSPTGGTLILTDLRWPGWTVQIDGLPVVPVNDDHRLGPYRAVVVPAGQHVVKWLYSPLSFWIGVGISLLTCVTLTAVACLVPLNLPRTD